MAKDDMTRVKPGMVRVNVGPPDLGIRIEVRVDEPARIADQICKEIAEEYGDEVWIGDGYAAGMDLREKIAAALHCYRNK